MLTLIDGNSLVFRAFFGMHRSLTRGDGTPVGAVFGFCNMILPVLAATKPGDRIVCVFDAARKNFRNEIYAPYKMNRTDTPPELIPQFPIARDAAAALGMPVLCIPDVEADDVIATLCAHECAIGHQTRIITSDKDLMQLVSDCVYLYDGMKESELREPAVLEKFGVTPDRVTDVQALMGDASDNIPGVPGIGPKTAGNLISEFGNLDNLYANLSAVKNERIRGLLETHRENAYISRQLATLKTDVELPEFNADFHFDMDRAIKFARDELQSPALVSRIQKLFPPLVKGAQDFVSEPSANLKNPGGIIGFDNKEKSPQELLGDKSPTNSIPPLSRWEIITTVAELDEFLATVGDTLAFDTETDDLNFMTARIVGLSLAARPDYGVYIPLNHKTQSADLFDNSSSFILHPSSLNIDTVREKLWPYFTNPNITKVAHNIKFDLHILENAGWDTDEIAPINDTMTMSYALYGASHGHGLDELAKIYLGHDMITFASLFPPKTKSADMNFADIAIPAAAEYASEDACACLGLYQYFKQQFILHPSSFILLYDKCDKPLPRILMHMERAGVQIDQAAMAKLSETFHAALAGLQSDIWKLVGREFNIASPKQMAAVLYHELALPAPKNESTDAAALNDIIDAHPVIQKILDWRSLAKLAGTYTDALPRSIGPDGRIHTTYLQVSTNTGRLSSRDPNLQNIPIKTHIGAEIRRCFVAPLGRKFVAADYSQIQLRLLADIANVVELKRAFETGADIHESTARKIFGIPATEPVPRELRARAKTVNFSIIYGVSAFGLAAQLDIPVPEAKRIIDSYMAGFPEIRDYMTRTEQFALEHGFVETPWGRRIVIPELNVRARRAYGLRAAINAPIQGAEADLMRNAMVKIFAEIAGTDAKMILQVHDEIVVECDENIADEIAARVKHAMETAGTFGVPIVADTHIDDRWEK